MKVHLIGMTAIDWNRYVTETTNILGRSPTRSLDNFSIPVGSNESFLASLGEFQRKDSDPNRFLKDQNITFKHVNVTFLCSVEKIIYEEIFFLSNYGLVFTINNETYPVEIRFIVTGSIYDWRNIILLCMKKDSSFYIRQFVYAIYSLLCNHYKIMYSEYRLVILSDGSYILEERK